MYTIPISQARSKLPSLVEDAATLAKTTYITVKGKVKAAIVNTEQLANTQATLEILSDPKAMKAIKQGKNEVKAGNLVDWEILKKDLDL